MPMASSPPPKKHSFLRRLSSSSSSSAKKRAQSPPEPVPKLPANPLFETMARQQPVVPPLIIPNHNGHLGALGPERVNPSRQPVRVRQQPPHPALASPPNSPPQPDYTLASMTFSKPPALRSPPPPSTGLTNQGYVGNGGPARPLPYYPSQGPHSNGRPKLEIIASSSSSTRRTPSASAPRQPASRSEQSISPPTERLQQGNGQFDDAMSHSMGPAFRRPSNSSQSSHQRSQTSRTPPRSKRSAIATSSASGSPISPTDRNGYFSSQSRGPSSNGSPPPPVPRGLPSATQLHPPRRLSTAGSPPSTERQISPQRNGSSSVPIVTSPAERQATLTVIASSDGTHRRQSVDRAQKPNMGAVNQPPPSSVSPSRPLPKHTMTKEDRPPASVVRPPELYPPSQRQTAAIDTRSPSSYAPKQLRTIPSARQVPTKRVGRASLAAALAQPKIAAALLPFLSINSFLALNASSDEVRKGFGGEMVGRWVLKEWGVNIGKERGRSWPGLGVWEGFLESLLHEVAAYSCYPVQYHQLLQHLCLSHTLVVLHLRTLPPSAFPASAQPSWDDELVTSPAAMSNSGSLASFASMSLGGARSRVPSTASSDAGSIRPSHMPRQERLIEIVMPEPLAAGRMIDNFTPEPPQLPSHSGKVRRRGSISSISSASFANWGRKRSNSTTSTIDPLSAPVAHAIHAAPMAEGKAAYPPVSFPMAKRYAFRSHGDPASTRQRTSSDSGRPGSIWSAGSSAPRAPSFAMRHAPPLPPFASSGRRTSVAGSGSPLNEARHGSPNAPSPSAKPEPAFDKPIPYTVDRAPALRVFVPLSASVRHWPSAEGAFYAMRELEKCGAAKRLKVGDLVVNPAIKGAYHVDKILVYVPNTQHLLLPLSKLHSGGHLPPTINALEIPPSYYLGLLPTPHIVYLDLAPFASQIVSNIRLTSHKSDVTTARGDRVIATRYLFVAGCEIRNGPWKGLLSLEAEGTAEGKLELEARVGNGDPSRAVRGPWEIVREMQGTVWLRLVRERGSEQ